MTTRPTVGRINFSEAAKPWIPPGLMPGPWRPDPAQQRRSTPLSDAQLDEVAAAYCEMMEAKGHPCDLVMVRRMALIQDAWRVAFGRVLGA